MIVIIKKNTDMDYCLGVCKTWIEAYGTMYNDMLICLADDKQKLCIEEQEPIGEYERYNAYLAENPEDVVTYTLYIRKE